MRCTSAQTGVQPVRCRTSASTEPNDSCTPAVIPPAELEGAALLGFRQNAPRLPLADTLTSRQSPAPSCYGGREGANHRTSPCAPANGLIASDVVSCCVCVCVRRCLRGSAACGRAGVEEGNAERESGSGGGAVAKRRWGRKRLWGGPELMEGGSKAVARRHTHLCGGEGAFVLGARLAAPMAWVTASQHAHALQRSRTSAPAAVAARCRHTTGNARDEWRSDAQCSDPADSHPHARAHISVRQKAWIRRGARRPATGKRTQQTHKGLVAGGGAGALHGL